MEGEPMSHQPFENWILGEEGLQEDQRQALAGHLTECTECARLSTSLAAVERTLTQSEVAAPAPGFGARFALRLEGRRVRAGRQQAWLAFGLAGAGACVAAVPPALRLMGEWTSPASMFVQLLIRAYDAWIALRVAGDFVRMAWNSLPEVVSPAGALAFAAACLGVGVIWIATLYRFAFRRVTEGA
jgi:hypothetical protein